MGKSGDSDRRTGGRLETPNLAMKLLRVRFLSREMNYSILAAASSRGGAPPSVPDVTFVRDARIRPPWRAGTRWQRNGIP